MKRSLLFAGSVLVAASMFGCIGDRGLRNAPAGGGFPAAVSSGGG